jgi:hypothetical protein
MLDQINDRYNQLNKLLLGLRETCNQLLEKMGPEVSLVNMILAEVEAATEKKKKLFEELRIIENDIELKKQIIIKIEETAHEKATEIIAAANQRNVQSIRILDQVKDLANEADLRERKNKLVTALGE